MSNALDREVWRVVRQRKKIKGCWCHSRYWSIRYRLPGMTRYVQQTTGRSEKRHAEAWAKEFIAGRMDELHHLGRPPVLLKAAQRPYDAHVGDFVADLNSRGHSKVYVRFVKARLLRLGRDCHWSRLVDVTADSFVGWRQNRGELLAPKTINDYLAHLIGLFTWLRRCGRWERNPVEYVGKVQTAGKQRRQRRVLTDAEVQRLMVAAGPHRVTYLLAVLTGLRRNELRRLVWGDVHLETPQPFLSVRASTTKNKKPAIIPLRDDVVAELRRIQPANVRGSVRVLRGLMPLGSAWRKDYQAASIPFKDSSGRIVDFHALRHTFNTNLARFGVPDAFRQKMTRHSNIQLTTGTYTDSAALATAPLYDCLPRPLLMTGTDGPVEVSRLASRLASHGASQSGVVSGIRLGSLVVGQKTTSNEKSPISRAFCDGLSRVEGDNGQVRAIGVEPTRGV